MAADTPQYGVDPQGQTQPMPQDQQQPVDPQQQVDPNSPPPDPMLAGPASGDLAQMDAAEFQTRERVELQLLLAIEACAKAAMVGEGASNQAFVQAYGQTCQSMALAYGSLAAVEQKENAPAAPNPFAPAQQGFYDNTGGQHPVQSPAQGQAA